MEEWDIRNLHRLAALGVIDGGVMMPWAVMVIEVTLLAWMCSELCCFTLPSRCHPRWLFEKEKRINRQGFDGIPRSLKPTQCSVWSQNNIPFESFLLKNKVNSNIIT